jgi:hypothetical protein
LASDEDFNAIILRGLRRKFSVLDVVRAYDAGLAGCPDDVILDWAAREERVLLTHDVSTMLATAYARIQNGEPMWGVLVVPQWLPIGRALLDLELIIECSEQREWRNRIDHLPLK